MKTSLKIAFNLHRCKFLSLLFPRVVNARECFRLGFLLLAVFVSSASTFADTIWATYHNANTLGEFGSDGSASGIYNTSPAGVSSPSGLALGTDGSLYVGFTSNDRIEKFSQTGVNLGIFASLGTQSPGALAFGPDGSLYAATGNQILKFTSTGTSSVFANPGITSGIGGIAFDSQGDLFVDFPTAQKIEKISPDGSQITTFASGGAPNYILTSPFGLTFDTLGNLYVSDDASAQIKEFSSAGAYLGVFASGNLNQPNGLAFDSQGDLYVGNGNGKIEKFSSGGTDLGLFANPGKGSVDYIVIVPEPSIILLLVLAFPLTFLFHQGRWRLSYK